MRIDTATASRLGIYFFYDADGIVDEYVLHWLREMRKSVSRLIVVANGELTDAGRTALEDAGAAPVIQRENEGFDVWAYKTAIDFVGWDELESFDEIILMNFTVLGPFGSFEPMFAEMDSRDLDFWGMTVHHGADFDPWGMMPDGVVPLHLQSHFIAVRRPMVSSAEFQTYWNEMFPVRSYEDSVGRHESLFTQRFERAGFTWDVYVDTRDIADRAYYPLFNDPVRMLEERQSPIFKRKGFFSLPETYLDENSNRSARQLLDHLKATDGYDADLVIQHSIRTANLYDMAMALNSYEILSSREPYLGKESTASVAVAVAVRSATELEAKRRYLESLPDRAELFIVSPQPVDTGSWSLAKKPTIEVIDDPNPSALRHWLGRVREFDLICIVEPSEADGLFPFSNQEAATDHYLDSVLASSDYVERVLARFEENPHLGSLVPIHPLHHVYFGFYGHEWADSYDAVASGLKKAGISVPINKTRPPVASESGLFWARSAALTPLLTDAASLTSLDDAALRRALPFVGQSAGFSAEYVAPDSIAANLLVTGTYAIRGINERMGLVRMDPRKMETAEISSVTSLFGRLDHISEYEKVMAENRDELFDVSEGFANALEILGNKDREIDQLHATVEKLRARVKAEKSQAAAQRKQVKELTSSRTWRIGRAVLKPLTLFRRK